MSSKPQSGSGMGRRQFLQLSAAAVGSVGALGVSGCATPPRAGSSPVSIPAAQVGSGPKRKYNGIYAGEQLNQIAFPLGGIGAGMICLEGTGALSHVSLRNRPEIFNEPETFAAIWVKGAPRAARVLEGPVPDRKKFGAPGTGNGASGSAFGLPRLREATFQARFPFATVKLADSDLPLQVELTGWSPFEPGDTDNACLPVAALEYRFTNPTAQPQEAVFSWNARNFMRLGDNPQAVKATPGGFVLWSAASAGHGWEEGAFAATVDDPDVQVNHC